MAEKFQFALVTPERELENSQAEMVIAPGTEGDFSVLAGHAPFMSTIRPGAVEVHHDGEIRKIFIRGGFADVTPSGLTLLATKALRAGEIETSKLRDRLKAAQQSLENAETPSEKEGAQDIIDFCEAILAES